MTSTALPDRLRLVVPVLAIALAGCTDADMRAREIAWAKQDTERAFFRVYDPCLYRVTGPFAAASFPVMKECERQACSAIAARKVQPVQCRIAPTGDLT